MRGDGASTARHCGNGGDIQIPEDGHRDRAGNGCRRENKQVWVLTFLAQRFALVHTKPVLFVNNYQPEVGEADGVREQRVGANNEVGGPGGSRQQGFLFCGSRQSTRK